MTSKRTAAPMGKDAELAEFAFRMIRAMEKEIQDTFWSDFKMTCVKFQFGFTKSGKFRRSWGGYDGFKKGMSGRGGGYVEIALARYRPKKPSQFDILSDTVVVPTMEFNEYKHIKKDKTIGALIGTRHKCLTALIAHEMAHALEHVSTIKLSSGLAKDLLSASTVSASFNSLPTGRVKGHGELWQKIYAHLRVKFVNHLI